MAARIEKHGGARVCCLVACAIWVGCSANPERPATATVEVETEVVAEKAAEVAGPVGAPPTMPETGPSGVVPDGAAIDARVEAGRVRLSASAPGQRVWQAIEAHGGLRPWYGSGALAFRFTYAPNTRPVVDTRNLVDVWSSRARQDLAAGSGAFGWDGTRAWVDPPDVQLPTNPRFWALTPYYFVGIPWVLADPGVVLEDAGPQEFEGRGYDTVKASFEPGTGDAPGDYYVVYVDRETHRVGAIRYVVSYPGFRPNGGHGPEKLFTYDGEALVSGLRFATGHRTYKWDGTSAGEQTTSTTVSDIRFEPGPAATAFDVPTSAKVLEGW
jgi:hypothetical protein